MFVGNSEITVIIILSTEVPENKADTLSAVPFRFDFLGGDVLPKLLDTF